MARFRFTRLFEILVVAFYCHGANAADYTMRVASQSDDLRNTAAEYIATNLTKATGGEISVELFKGTLGNEREQLERLQLGTLEAYIGSTGPLRSLTGIPLSGLFDVPYLFEDWDHLYRVTKSEIGRDLRDQTASKGIRILDYLSMGTRAVYTRSTPIIQPEDLKGLKIRTMESPVYLKLYKSFGAIPVPMAWSEIYTSLQTGVIDGVDGSLASGLDSKQTEAVKYVTLLGNHVVIASIVAVSERWWNELPADLQQAVASVVSEAAQVEQMESARLQASLKRKWEEQGVKFTSVDKARFQELAKVHVYPLVESEISEDILAKVRAMAN